jgi:hypothetical protein
MLIRDAIIEDYNQIRDLNLNHNLQILSKEQWIKIWNKNPYFNFNDDIIGWVIEDNKKIKGFLGCFKKKYIDDEGNEFNSLICHNWVVDIDCRSLSLNLLNKFFSYEGFDFYINSTASFEVAKVWEAFGAQKIPLNNIQSSLFIPINNEKVSKKIFSNKLLKFFLKKFFKYYTKFIILSGKKSPKYQVEIIDKYDDEIKKFENFNNNVSYLKEKINYDWYIDILSKDNHVNFLKIYKQEILVGFCVLITPKMSNFKKTYIAHVQINNDYKFDKILYKIIIKEIFIYSKNLNSDLIELKYIDENIFSLFKKILLFHRKYKHCSFYFYSHDKNTNLKLSKKNWMISMLSGDSFLI